MGYRGYISSRSFMENRVPQHVQNLVIRDYCLSQGFNYLLSGTEYAMPGSYLVLQQLLNELPAMDGIVTYSMFQLPDTPELREVIFKRVLDSKCSIHFAVESIGVSSLSDIQRVEDIWGVYKIMKHMKNTQEII